jgi:site-specific DNA recombinase
LEKELDRIRDRGRDEDQLTRVEARLAEIAEELAVLQATTIDKRDLAKALSAFHEVWSFLLPQEQERVINLLIERIEFDAGRETVAITFKPTGIRSLADEVAMAQEALR